MIAQLGGAIYAAQEATITFIRSIFRNNEITDYVGLSHFYCLAISFRLSPSVSFYSLGGCFFDLEPLDTYHASRIFINFALHPLLLKGHGGAIYAFESTKVIIKNTTFEHNSVMKDVSFPHCGQS